MKLRYTLLIPLLFLSCGTVPPVVRDPVPAEAEATRLRDIPPPAAAEVVALRADELTASKAAATAFAKGDAAEAARQSTLAAKIAEIRVAAEAREKDQRAQLAALAADADRRAKSERAELDQRKAALDQAAADQADRDRAAGARFWCMLALGGCVAVGVALRAIGLPLLLSAGLPGAVAAGCAFVIAFTSVPWLGAVLGIALAVVVLAGLAVVIRTLVHEWLTYADHLSTAMPDAKSAADNASIARQPAWMRWIVGHLLAARP